MFEVKSIIDDKNIVLLEKETKNYWILRKKFDLYVFDLKNFDPYKDGFMDFKNGDEIRSLDLNLFKLTKK